MGSIFKIGAIILTIGGAVATAIGELCSIKNMEKDIDDKVNEAIEVKFNEVKGEES